jgi:cob(I)alamin adenosyltransferase
MDPVTRLFGTIDQLHSFIGLSWEITRETWEMLKAGTITDEDIIFTLKGE